MSVISAPARPARVRPLWRDVSGAAVFFVLGGLYYAAGLQSAFRGEAETVSLGWRLIVLAVACAALLLRGRAPVLALGIGLVPFAADVVLGLSLPVMLTLTELLYTATLYSSRRVNRALVAVVAATALVTTVTMAVLVPDWRLAFTLSLSLVMIPIIPVWWAMNVRQHREMAETERARAEQLARIAELDHRAAVAGERARMARDLHDVIAGHLSAIALQSEAVLSMADGDPATARTVLRSVRENSVQALAEMRAMIGLLRADGPDGTAAEKDPHTAPARLRDLGRLVESARAGGLQVAVVTDPIPEDAKAALPAAVDLTAYRIVQEALTNAVRHASGSRAWVALNREDGRLIVEVTNELPGTSHSAVGEGAGTGLMSMRERAKAVGGSLWAGRCANGWRVRAVLPTGGDT